MKKFMCATLSAKVVVSIIVIAVVITGAYLGMRYMNNQQSGMLEVGSEFDPEFEEDQYRESNEGGASGGIEIPGYSTITVPDGEKNVSVNFYNPEKNGVYFEISLTLADSGEELYKSKLLSPGQHLYEIELNRALEAGEYEMVITYNTYAMDEEYTPKNGATVNCILAVES